MTSRVRPTMLLGLVVPVAVFAAWWFLSAGSVSPFYPPLRTILVSFHDTWLFSRFQSDIVPSLERMAAGYLLAVLLGIAFGFLLGRHRALAAAVRPVLEFSRALPAVALIPVSTTLFGIGATPKIALIAFACVFPVLLNTVDGVRGVDPALEDVGRSFRLSRMDRIFQVQLPSAAPQIFVGMRVALAFAFIMMIVSEMVGATNGIGYITLNAQQSFQIPQMWAGMLLLGLLGTVLNVLFVLFERRAIRWHFLSHGR